MKRRNLAMFSLACVTVLTAREWPQWRGVNRNGHASDFTAPAKWPKALEQVWKIPTGGGYSSPVLAEGAIYVFSREGENEQLSRIEAKTGKETWKKSYPAPFQKNQYALAHGKGPFSTPAVDGGRVYTLGVMGVLTAWNAADGRQVWRADYSPRINTDKLFTGTAMSPIADRGTLFVHIGDDRGGEVLALDSATGKPKWSWKGDGPGYASPVIADLNGVRQWITQTDRSVIGLDAATGRLLWRLPWKDEWNENIITPVVWRDTLILSGVRKPAIAVRVAGPREKMEAQEVWRNADVSFYMSTPVVDGEVLYGLSSKKKGQFVCLDVKTGRTRWLTQGREAQSASIVAAGNVLLITTTEGDLIVAARNPDKFEMLSRYTVAESATFSHPAVSGRDILVKDTATLTLWRVP